MTESQVIFFICDRMQKYKKRAIILKRENKIKEMNECLTCVTEYETLLKIIKKKQEEEIK